MSLAFELAIGASLCNLCMRIALKGDRTFTDICMMENYINISQNKNLLITAFCFITKHWNLR